ncbi:hypothetical protein [Hymenobacter koreensis]|uniref:Uncharacterized protein n=1 Tax=Hymenobacter koreensis TaxID=1084523 RepID=A0ABP8JNB8_9BACT
MMSAAEYRALHGKKPAKTPGKPSIAPTPPKPPTDTPEAQEARSAPVWKPLKVEISGFTFANQTKRVVTLCPEAHAEDLQTHIEAFRPKP